MTWCPIARRRIPLVITMAAALGGCRSRASEDPQPRRDAARANDAAALVPDASAPDADVQAYLDGLAPRSKAPRPTIRKHRRGDCKTAYAPRPERDPNPMCRVTGGTFMMGGAVDPSLEPAIGPTPVPVATTVGDFDIDQFEVTAQQAALFLDAHGNHCPGLHGHVQDQRNECMVLGHPVIPVHERDGRFFARPGLELKAATFSFEGALRYCAWVGKRVPSSAQWEYAARHDPVSGRDLVYPWGDQWERDRAACHTIEDSCTRMATEAEYRLVGRFDGTRGRHDGSSPWGVHDMVDNHDELLFACDDANATCIPGLPCTCRLLSSTAGQSRPLALTTFTRFEHAAGGDTVGLRCVRPR